MLHATIRHKTFTFPCGEPHVQLDTVAPSRVDVLWEFAHPNEIVELLLLEDAIRRAGHRLNMLTIPYVPFARQDRVNLAGESLSIAVMARVINGLHATSVQITDPHSDVAPALIRRCHVVHQHEVFSSYFPIGFGSFHLVSPDAGALKKIYKLARLVDPTGVIECGKHRDVATGEISGTTVPNVDVTNGHCIIVDDICDGGRTFVELAKVLHQRGAGKITLMVTHGFFTKGLQVFDGLIDEIYTRKGRVK